jgi:hypothetical protein
MVKLIFILITLFFVWIALRNKENNRLIAYLLVILFLPNSIILLEKPFIVPTRLLTMVIAFMCLIQEPWREWKRFPLKIAFVATFFCLLMVGIFDERLSFVSKFARPAGYFLHAMFICYLSFLCLKKEEDWKAVSRALFFSSIVLCVYGLFNYLVQFNHYNDVISSYTDSVDVANRFQGSSLRPRISSFTSNAIYYGFLTGMIAIVFFCDYTKPKDKILSLKSFVFISFLLLVNLYLSNSRTPYFVFLAGVVVYLTFSSDMKGLKRNYALFFVVFLIGLTIPAVQDMLFQLTDIFSRHPQIGGSSLEMRMEQLEGAIRFFGYNIFTGNGIGYIREDIGFSLDSDIYSMDDMLGFESYAFEVLIEQGIVGVVANLVFFSSIFFWLFKQMKYSMEIKQVAALGIAVTANFLLFSLATATLGAWSISMLFLGVCIKRIVLMKENLQD